MEIGGLADRKKRAQIFAAQTGGPVRLAANVGRNMTESKLLTVVRMSVAIRSLRWNVIRCNV